MNSDFFSLKKIVPVSFVDNAAETKRLQVREGFKLALNCSATGNPAPAYGWDKVDSNTPILFNNKWLGNRLKFKALLNLKFSLTSFLFSQSRATVSAHVKPFKPAKMIKITTNSERSRQRAVNFRSDSQRTSGLVSVRGKQRTAPTD